MLSLDILRLIAVKALKGQTWAEDKVFDSPATVADLRIESERQPFIAVFVDEGDTEGIEYPAASGPLNTKLIIEAGVASSIVLPVLSGTAPEPSSGVTQLNDTDAGLEMTIGFLAQQVRDAFLSTSNPWAELFREFTGAQLRRLDCVRGGPSADQSKPPQRYASRILIFHTGVLAMPPRGAHLESGTFWPHFLEMAAADQELAGIGELVSAHLIYPSGELPEWRMAQKYLGSTADIVQGLGISPYQPSDQIETQETPIAPVHEIVLPEQFGGVTRAPGEDLEMFPDQDPDDAPDI